MGVLDNVVATQKLVVFDGLNFSNYQTTKAWNRRVNSLQKIAMNIETNMRGKYPVQIWMQ